MPKDEPRETREEWADRQVAKAPPLGDEIAARIARALGLNRRAGGT